MGMSTRWKELELLCGDRGSDSENGSSELVNRAIVLELIDYDLTRYAECEGSCAGKRPLSVGMNSIGILSNTP